MRHHSLSHVRHSAVLLVLALCATPAVGQSDPDPAGGALCLARNVQRLDDRSSDASTIARAAVAACRNERFAAIKVLKPEVRDELIARALDGLRQHDVDETTAVVLEWRRRAR